MSEPTSELHIGPVTDAADAVPLARLVNEVYAAGEIGLWRGEVERTDPAELVTAIDAGMLVGAWIDGALIGCVRLRVIDDRTAELGILAARSDLRHIGVGRDLMDYAETWARDSAFHRMQLELLKPHEGQHPVKEFLHAWYSRRGYQVISTEDCAVVLPIVKDLLAGPSDFLVFWKTL